MAEKFAGDSQHFRNAASAWLARVLHLSLTSWAPLQRSSFEDFAVVLSLVPELPSWSEHEKGALLRIIRAKSALRETRYLTLLQQHRQLRQVFLKLGS